jgi:hypothetical protein
VRPSVELIVQLAYQHWSDFPSPTDAPIGGTRIDPGFHDTPVPRLGAEFSGAALGGRWVARAGYAFFWSPAPEMRGSLSLFDNHRHLFAAGSGLSWPALGLPVYIDAWVQFHLLMERTHHKADAAVDTGGHFWATGLAVGVDL